MNDAVTPSSKRKNISETSIEENILKKMKPDNLMVIDKNSDGEKKHRVNFHSLDQYTRHKLLINYYQLTSPGKYETIFQNERKKIKTDLEVLKENHRFIWSDEDLESGELTWGQRLAKKYYSRLFKEYCIVDLSLFDQNKFGMRWRTEPEIINGKGQFVCGAKRCDSQENLNSWEVLFGYEEHGKKQSALVKLRLCPECSAKLNYHREHKKIKKLDKKRRKYCKEKQDEYLKDDRNETGDYRIKKLNEEHEDNFESEKNERTEESYEELIEKIWRQPIKLDENECDSQNDEQQTRRKLEEDLDSYLDGLFD